MSGMTLRNSGTRRTRYPALLTLRIKHEMMSRIDALADEHGESRAEVVRDAIRRGLPLTRQAWRRAAHKERQYDDPAPVDDTKPVDDTPRLGPARDYDTGTGAP